MSGILNNLGFCIVKASLTLEQKRKLTSDLNVSPHTTFGNFDVKSFKVYSETKEYYVIPLYYSIKDLGVSPMEIDFPDINYISNSQAVKLITLRDNQKECFSNAYSAFSGNDYGGGIIQLETGMGKTVLSINLILKTKLKTLIIVNKIELMRQWTLEIKKWAPCLKVSFIQGEIFDSEDCDICIGMLQTISMRKDIISKRFDVFSMCIIDEVHNVSSEVFSKVMQKVRPRYLYGLTATLERKDKLEKIIKWYIGDVLYDINKNKQLKQSSDIYALEYFGDSSVEKTLKDGTAAVSSMLSKIAEDNIRSKMIVNVINKLLENSDKRNILVISDRIFQLKYLNKCLGNVISGLFIGGMKTEELNITKTKRVILGTYPLVSEGFNQPKLNCLIFATPRSNVTQSVGRIYRKEHFDVTPIIIDIFDNFSIFKHQHYKRKRLYKKDINDCCIFTNKLADFTVIKEKVKYINISIEPENFEKCLLLD